MTQRVCIFCEGKGLSKEHFWPDWICNHIQKSDTDKHTAEVYSGDVKSKPELEKKTERPGNLITKKFRVVCIKCNNGWMSQLEESIKPFILSAIRKKIRAAITNTIQRNLNPHDSMSYLVRLVKHIVVIYTGLQFILLK